MPSSLLIRNQEGTVIGYVLTTGEALCIRAAGQGMQALARICDGTDETTIEMTCDGREYSFQWNQDKRIEWVRIEREERTIAVAGPAPQMRREEKTEQEKKDAQTCKNSLRSDVYIQSEDCPDRKEHERRWPPPPCWPSARYVQGEWKEGDA